jgi:hypothetical protein
MKATGRKHKPGKTNPERSNPLGITRGVKNYAGDSIAITKNTRKLRGRFPFPVPHI